MHKICGTNSRDNGTKNTLRTLLALREGCDSICVWRVVYDVTVYVCGVWYMRCPERLRVCVCVW